MGRFNSGQRGSGGRGGRGGRGRGRGRGGGFGRGGARKFQPHTDGEDFNFGSDEPGVRLGVLPEETLSYYRNVLQTLQSFGEQTGADVDTKEEFMNNVFNAFREEAVTVSQNQTVSWILESLMAQAQPKHLRSVVKPMFSELTLVVFDRFSSHVTQALVEYLPAMYEEIDSDQETEALEFKTWVETLLKFMESHLRDVMTHTYGSHVLRSLLEVLGGVKVTEQVVRQKQGKGSMSKKEKALSPLIDYTKYSAFSKDYQAWFETLKDKVIRLCNFTEHLNDISYSPVLQTVLLILNKSAPDEYSKLSGTIIENTCINWNEDETSNNPAERLPEIVQGEVGSYLIELLLTLASPDQLKYIYENVFRNRIIYFCVHPRANYVFQTLLTAVEDKNLVLEILEELSKYFEDVLAVNHVGIIIKLAGACLRAGIGQDRMMQLLMAAFHCEEPDRQSKLCPLIASFRTFEVFTKTESGDENQQPSKNLLTDIVIHGALLLQQLLQFDNPEVVVTSLLALTSTELALMGGHQNGSYVIDTFIQSPKVKQKSKEAFVKKMLGMYSQLAIGKYGSRTLENIWKECSIPQRILIAEDLCKSLDRLEGDFCGKFICHNFGLLKFQHRRNEWLQLQGASSKKQKALKEVLKGKSKKERRKVTGGTEPADSQDPLEHAHEDMEETDMNFKKKSKKEKKKYKESEVGSEELSMKTPKKKKNKLKGQTEDLDNDDETINTAHNIKEKKKKKEFTQLQEDRDIDQTEDKVTKKKKKKLKSGQLSAAEESSVLEGGKKKKKVLALEPVSVEESVEQLKKSKKSNNKIIPTIDKGADGNKQKEEEQCVKQLKKAKKRKIKEVASTKEKMSDLGDDDGSEELKPNKKKLKKFAKEQMQDEDPTEMENVSEKSLERSRKKKKRKEVS